MSSKLKGTIAILTGGGDVPGLNPAIRAVTLRAIREGYKIIGIKRGWAGITEIIRDAEADNSNCFIQLNENTVNKANRTGGTFLHTSRTKPNKLPKNSVPNHLKDIYTDEINDLTEEVIKNIQFLEIDYFITIGGDDTLSYAVTLHQKGVKVVAIPKTMDNDVPGTDYCIGFSTCISETINMTNALRTVAGSSERILVIEVFGRYAGFTALLPTMAGAADRCVIPEYKFDINKLTQLLVEDREKNSSKYSVLLISEGATFEGVDMIYKNAEKDQFGHAKLGGIGELVSSKIKELSPKYNNNQTVNTISQKLEYLTRSGVPDAMDSIIPMAFGNLALDLILKGEYGKLVGLKNGKYDNFPIEIVTSGFKKVNIEKFYDTERLRPNYKNFDTNSHFIITGD